MNLSCSWCCCRLLVADRGDPTTHITIYHISLVYLQCAVFGYNDIVTIGFKERNGCSAVLTKKSAVKRSHKSNGPEQNSKDAMPTLLRDERKLTL